MASGRFTDINAHQIPDSGLNVLMRPGRGEKIRYVYMHLHDEERTEVGELANGLAKLRKAAEPGHEAVIVVRFRILEDQVKRPGGPG